MPNTSGNAAVTTPTRQRPAVRRPFRKLIEFKEIRSGDLGHSRRVSRKVYDGPAGAMLAFASFVSLHEPLLGALLRRGTFDVSRFGRILDIGSGAGQILGHLLREARPDATIVAADLSHRMLRRARNRLKTNRPAFLAADVTRLPFADGNFDCITCGWVIEHLPDPEPGLREMRRILRPGGSLLLLATEDTVTGALNSRTWKCRTYNRSELRAACERNGLAWSRQFYLSPVHRLLKIGGIIVEAVRIDESGEAVRQGGTAELVTL
jgi:SAM-dependent methyltransferase